MSKEAAMAIATGVKNETPATVPSESQAGAPAAGAAVPAVAAPTDDQRVQALIKKEVRLVKEQEQFKKDRAALEEKVKKAEALLERDRQFDETKKTDTIAALKMLGFNDNEIFDALSKSVPKDKSAEQVAREAALDEIKKADDKRSAEAKEQEAKKNESIIKSFKSQISNTIEKNPDKFEYCKFNGPFAEELIYETVEQVLKTEKKLISVDEAAVLVESYYEENAKAMDGLKKRKPQAPVEAPVEKKAETKITQPAGKPKTLTNNIRPTAAATAEKKESSDQKRARLEEALRQGVHPSQLR